MRILIMMAQAFFPRQAGGLQTAAKAIADTLEAAGHEVAIAAEMSLRGTAGLRAAAGMVSTSGRFSRERFAGRRVFRVRRIARRAAFVLDEVRPDCVIVQAMDAMPVAHAVSQRSIPLVVSWHDVELHRLAGTPAGLVARFVANSQFTASVYQEAFGIQSAVIPPVIQRALYETPPAERTQVTFVNPVPDKGLALALDIAAGCPDISFEFVESWILEAAKKRALLARLAGLPNVRFTPHQTVMRPVYARTRLLLAPSQWREAWGRVASESHVSGIPVLGSRIGGLVESIGPGGVLVAPGEPASEWIKALRSIWDDPAHYAALSAAASAYAMRRELDQNWATARMLEEIEAARLMRR